MVELMIREARPDEHNELSALAMRSKGHWGYSSEFLESCRAELTYDAAECGSGRIWVAVAESEPVGFSFLSGHPPTGELAALFVDPIAIGTGVGKVLLAHVLHAASAERFARLALDADPAAESFYLHFGATRIGSSPSGSIPERELPHLVFELNHGGPPAPQRDYGLDR